MLLATDFKKVLLILFWEYVYKVVWNKCIFCLWM